MRAVLAGGGTGGHVIPALAIARELGAAYGAVVIFMGTPRGLENRLVPAAGYELRLVQVGALNKVSLATRAKTLLDLPRAVLAARRILKDFRPDVVIGVGGYASGPAMLAAKLSGIPMVAFEPNVVPGFANRVVARMVAGAAVHFPETCKWFPNCKVTGVPVRREFFQIPARQGDGPTLLVFGGSQGARAINRAMLDSFPALRQRIPRLRILHQTGERDYNEAQAEYARAGMTSAAGGARGAADSISAEVFPFIDDMPGAFARADLLICRSGASTVAEVMAAGKAAIFIPFPQAADDHQLRNAEALARQDAGVLIPQAELTPERLVSTAAELFADPQRLAAMGTRARQLAHADAAEQIAALAAEVAGKR